MGGQVAPTPKQLSRQFVTLIGKTMTPETSPFWGEIPEVEDVTMNLVWSPMWTPERIEPRVRAYLGF